MKPVGNRPLAGMTRLHFDIETDGFLSETTRIHSLCIMDDDTGDIISCAQDKDGMVPEGYLPVEDGLRLLERADEIVGHNIIKFDIPAIQKLYPKWEPQGLVTDTLILSQLLYLDLQPSDQKRVYKGTLPGKLVGKHSLEAWGYRLGEMKGEYKDLPIHLYRACAQAGVAFRDIAGPEGQSAIAAEILTSTGTDYWEGADLEKVARRVVRDLQLDLQPFAVWCTEMQDYCEQDVRVTKKLWDVLKRKEYKASVYDLEADVARLCHHMEQTGFVFDREKAFALQAELEMEKAAIFHELSTLFPDWVEPERRDEEGIPVVTTAKKTRNVKLKDFPDIRRARYSEKTGKRLKDYVGPPICTISEGAQYTKVKWVSFDPGSRDRIASRLIAKYDWTPTALTDTGKPKVDDETLSEVAEKYPECAKLARYFTIIKRLGQLADGKNSWLNHALEENGNWFVRGSYLQLGTVTHRNAHFRPNIGQVPAADAEVLWGEECRNLFTVPEGWSLVGSDLAGLELCCLGHYMAKYDGGEYIRVILEGDVHWTNVQALGLVEAGVARDKHDEWHDTARNKIAKTWFYGFLYGSGDLKSGIIYVKYRPLTEEEIGKYGSDKRAQKYIIKKGMPRKKINAAKVAIGRKLKETFLDKTPALKDLIKDLKHRLKENKMVRGDSTIKGLDGRRIHVRSDHAILNTLLQSAGAIICKEWIVRVHKKLQKTKHPETGELLRLGWDGDVAICAWVHDELQIACKKGLEDIVGNICKEAAQEVAPYFNFRAPTEADYAHGSTWAATH